MQALMKYNNYKYRPHRGGHNMFSPVELASLKAFDESIGTETPRQRASRKLYNERHKERRLAYGREYRAKKRAGAPSKDATP